MTEEEVKSKVTVLLRQWLDDRILSGSANSTASALKKRISSDWDGLLNRLHIRRIENHLPKRTVRKGCFRIQDPFRIGVNRNRDLEIELDTANKMLVLGLP